MDGRGLSFVAVIAGAIGLAVAMSSCDAAQTTGPHPKAVKSERCASCHIDDYEEAHHGQKPLACAVCHSQKRWRPLVDEDRVHAWKLEGKHVQTDCYGCHVVDEKKAKKSIGETKAGKARIFDGTATKCIGCHEKDRANADAKLEWHRDFEPACENCHDASAWKPAHHEVPEPPPSIGSVLEPPPPPPSGAASGLPSANPQGSGSARVVVSAKPIVKWPKPPPSIDIITRPSRREPQPEPGPD